MISSKMQNMIGKSSIIRSMFEEGKALSAKFGAENVFDFSLGNPNIPSPPQLNRAISEIVNTVDGVTLHGYMSNSGHDSTRNAIANSLNARYGTDYDTSNIVMTVGAAGGLNVLLKCLVNPADEVIVFSPYFGEYANYIDNYDGKLVAVECPPPDFLPDANLLAQAITPRTKVVIINNPNNPTGAVYDSECLAKIAQTLRDKQAQFGQPIFLIADEPYRELVFDGAQVEHLPLVYDNTIIAYSYSKSLSLAGERIGYIAIGQHCADKNDLVSACGVATRILGFVNAPSLQQLTIEKCVDLTADLTAYDNNRKLLSSSLAQLGFEFAQPRGAFYLFVRTPIDDLEFCNMAKKYNILIVPSRAFGCKGYARIAYCVSEKTIKNSLPSFAKLAKELNISSI
ncbi:MAG: pyridoxal phosphate-dependent aminotransferase [Clostridia bacterium]